MRLLKSALKSMGLIALVLCLAMLRFHSHIESSKQFTLAFITRQEIPYTVSGTSRILHFRVDSLRKESCKQRRHSEPQEEMQLSSISKAMKSTTVFGRKSSYRRYSFKELFEWKFKRPWTPADGVITSEQARQWFIERHRVLRNPVIGSSYYDDPRDVKTFSAPLEKVCFQVANPPSGVFSRHSFSGEIHFPNGVRCRIDPYPTDFRESFGSDGSPHVKKLKIKKPCIGC